MYTQLLLAPNVKLILSWSERLTEALREHFPGAPIGVERLDEASRLAYEGWDHAIRGAGQQIVRLYQATGNLPIPGDFLSIGRPSALKSLQVDEREFFTTQESDELCIAYRLDSRYWDEDDPLGG